MNDLANRLLKIKEFLNDKERWDTYRNVPDDTFNLRNELAGLWQEEKRDYPAAYQCVARAALDLLEDKIKAHLQSHKISISGYATPEPRMEDIRAVWAFEEICTHEELMAALNLAIRYANLIAFS